MQQFTERGPSMTVAMEFRVKARMARRLAAIADNPDEIRPLAQLAESCEQIANELENNGAPS